MLTKEQLNAIQYTDLNHHSMYSMPVGIGTIKDHIKESVKKHHRACCITDHEVMSGGLPLYRLSKDKDFLQKSGIEKPVICVIGAELLIARTLDDHSPDTKYSNITIFAKNDAGYRNLCYLTSIGSTPDHFYMRNRISMEELIANKEGLIVTSGAFNFCSTGLIPQAIIKQTGDEEELVQKLKQEFGDDFLIEIHFTDQKMRWDKTLRRHIDQGSNPQEEVNKRLFELAKKFDVKCFLAQGSHMPKKEHHFIQNIIIGNAPSGKDGWHFYEPYYLMTVEEMYERVQQVAPYITDEMFIEFCNNTNIVVDACKDIRLEFEPLLPKIDYDNHPINQGERHTKLEKKLNMLQQAFSDMDDEFVYLIELSKTDISLRTALKVIIENNKIDLTNDEYRKRLVLEINAIQRNGVVKLLDYFLLLWDVTFYVKNSGLQRGFGRGSGGGSMLAYCLDVTDCDPLKFGLLFERFLSAERIGRFNFEVPEVPKKK